MNDFWRSVASVLTGSVVAQLIPIVGSVVIARLFLPSEFGMFSAWFGVVQILGVVVTGRFETALAIEVDGEPRRLGVLSTFATVGMAGVAAGLLLVAAALVVPDQIGRFSLWLVITFIPAALVTAATQVWQSWAAAEGQYRDLSFMRIVLAGTVTVCQIAVGLFAPTAAALAMAYVAGSVAGLLFAAHLMPTGAFPTGRVGATTRQFWRRYRRFPLFSLPADSINTLAAQLPILIVAGKFGAEVAGLLAMAMRILGTPIGLLGKSVLDVFKRHAAASFRERGECRREYLQTFKVLAIASLAFCAVMAVASEPLFALVFGERWRGAGTIAVWLLPLFALRFIASPLSYMVYIADKQHIDLFWQISLLAMTYLSLSIPHTYALALQAYSIGYSLLYVVYLVMSYRFSLGEVK